MFGKMSRSRSNSNTSMFSTPSASAFRSRQGAPGTIVSLGRRIKHRMPRSTNLIAKQAWLNASFLRKIVHPELKSQTQTIGSTTIDSGGEIRCLSLLGQGTAEGNRVATSIQARSLDVIFEVIGAATNPQTDIVLNSSYLFWIFIDTANDGAAPPAADMPADPNFFRLNNSHEASRYKTLAIIRNIVDTIYTTTANQFHPRSDTKKLERRFMKLDLSVNYQGSDATISSVGRNSIWMYVIGDSATVAGGAPNYSGQARLRYYDS